MESTKEIAELLCSQANAVATILTDVSNLERTVGLCEEIIGHEKEVDRLYYEGLNRLFDSSHDPLNVIKEKQIMDDLRDTARSAKTSAEVILVVARS